MENQNKKKNGYKIKKKFWQIQNSDYESIPYPNS
jgi:hypothetical protein